MLTAIPARTEHNSLVLDVDFAGLVTIKEEMDRISPAIVPIEVYG